MNIGEQIKKFRVKNNLTQKGLAEKLNISYQSVSKWENGQAEPSIDCVISMANLFGASLDAFLGVRNFEKPDDFFKKISATSIKTEKDATLKSGQLDNFFQKIFPVPASDPYWQENAVRYIKGFALYLLYNKKCLSVKQLWAEMFLDKLEPNRQDKLIENMKNAPDFIQKNVAAVLEAPEQTFKSFMSVVANLLETLEKAN